MQMDYFADIHFAEQDARGIDCLPNRVIDITGETSVNSNTPQNVFLGVGKTALIL